MKLQSSNNEFQGPVQWSHRSQKIQSSHNEFQGPVQWSHRSQKIAPLQFARRRYLRSGPCYHNVGGRFCEKFPQPRIFYFRSSLNIVRLLISVQICSRSLCSCWGSLLHTSVPRSVRRWLWHCSPWMGRREGDYLKFHKRILSKDWLTLI